MVPAHRTRDPALRGRGPDRWKSGRRGTVAMIVGLVIALVIVAVLVWVIGTFPRPGWRGPVTPVPTAPAPLPQ